MNTLSPKKTFSRSGLILLLGMILSAATGIIALMPLAKPDAMAKILEVIGASGAFLLMYAPKFLMLLFVFLMFRTIPKCTWEKESLNFRALARIFVMTYAVSVVINWIGMLFAKAFPGGGSQETTLINSMVGSGVTMGFLVVSLIGPVVEELIFRKLMIDRLHNYGETTAIIFTALCFGLFHQNLTQFFYATSVGIFLGYVYCKTGKVLYTMIIHILLNTFSSLIVMLTPTLGGGNKIILLILVAAGLGMMLVMMITGFMQLIRTLKTKDVRLDDSMPGAIPRGKVLQTVYLNPGVILCFAFCIAAILMGLFSVQILVGTTALQQ